MGRGEDTAALPRRPVRLQGRATLSQRAGFRHADRGAVRTPLPYHGGQSGRKVGRRCPQRAGFRHADRGAVRTPLPYHGGQPDRTGRDDEGKKESQKERPVRGSRKGGTATLSSGRAGFRQGKERKGGGRGGGERERRGEREEGRGGEERKRKRGGGGGGGGGGADHGARVRTPPHLGGFVALTCRRSRR